MKGVQLALAFFRAVTFKFIHNAEESGNILFLHAVFRSKPDPGFPVRDAHNEVVLRKAQFPHAVDGQGYQFGIRPRGGFSQNVRIELIKFAQTPFLGFFITEA